MRKLIFFIFVLTISTGCVQTIRKIVLTTTPAPPVEQVDDYERITPPVQNLITIISDAMQHSGAGYLDASKLGVTEMIVSSKDLMHKAEVRFETDNLSDVYALFSNAGFKEIVGNTLEKNSNTKSWYFQKTDRSKGYISTVVGHKNDHGGKETWKIWSSIELYLWEKEKSYGNYYDFCIRAENPRLNNCEFQSINSYFYIP